jgi:hypothetical protein
MKPHAACSTGRANTTESTPSRPLRSTAHVCVRSRVRAVRWRTSMHRVDTWIPPCPAHDPDAGVRTTPSSRAHHATPIATAPRERTLALPSRRAVTSLPLS